MAPWLARFLTLAAVRTSVLRGTFIAFDLLGVLSEQRAAIAHELAVRAWAEAVEERLGSTIGWCRGGKS